MKNIPILAILLAAFASGGRAQFALHDGALWNGPNRFPIRGVAYSNVPIGQQPFGPEAPAPCLFARDLPLIAALGANTVRTYTLLPDGDATFTALLDSANLYWLAGFPLDPFYDPTRTIASQRTQILQAFQNYASRFQNQPRLIAYVFGNEVASNYNSKFAGSSADFYALLNDAATILQALQPGSPPLLTTAVTDPNEFVNDSSGLSFWSWNAYPGLSFQNQLQSASQKTTKPILISEYGVDAFNQASGQEDEALQAEAANTLTSQIQAASFLLGGVYSEFADQWWKGGPDASTHGYGGQAVSGFPDGFRNEAWQGIFRSLAAGQPGFDTLNPRVVFNTLAALWGGAAPSDWAANQTPAIGAMTNAASGASAGSPGALVSITGNALADAPVTASSAATWPLYLAFDCLCAGNAAAPLGLASPGLVNAQLPWSLTPGNANLVFYHAGVASDPLSVPLQPYSPGIFPGGVMRPGSGCQVSSQNGIVPGAYVEVYGTGFGPASTGTADIQASVNGVSARVAYVGLVPTAVGLTQIDLQIDPNTPPSPAATLQLWVNGTPSNLYPLSVPAPADLPAILLGSSAASVALQPGGQTEVNIAVAGANNFCGAVAFNSPNLPDGISYTIPPSSVGQIAPLVISAASSVRPLQNATFVLNGTGAAFTGELDIGLTVLPAQGDIPVRVLSGGYAAKPLAEFDWNSYTLYSTNGGGPGRGINVIAVAPDSGLLSPVQNFDTWGDENAGAALIAYLAGLPDGTLAMFSVADEASYRLGSDARNAIAAGFGSQFIASLGYQQSWALIGRKGKSPIAEGASATSQVTLDRVLTFPMP
jgi:uncharacterized protein (TIGR03437 family)